MTRVAHISDFSHTAIRRIITTERIATGKRRSVAEVVDIAMRLLHERYHREAPPIPFEDLDRLRAGRRAACDR